jgi:hypothetical protein
MLLCTGTVIIMYCRVIFYQKKNKIPFNILSYIVKYNEFYLEN